ncbi:MAG: GtrA family protein [Chlorobi bacterium]|nr:GtrA family protein [Chlorobiota bacterium]
MLKTIKDRIDKKFIIRFVKFGIVGGSGLFVNMFLLWFGKEVLSLPLTIASLIAIGISIFTNFVLNNFWTWKDNSTKNKYSFFHRMWRYYVTASLSATINYITLIVLSEYVGIYYLIANLIGIGFGIIFNFGLGEFWVFKKKEN